MCLYKAEGKKIQYKHLILTIKVLARTPPLTSKHNSLHALARRPRLYKGVCDIWSDCLLNYKNDDILVCRFNRLKALKLKLNLWKHERNFHSAFQYKTSKNSIIQYIIFPNFGPHVKGKLSTLQYSRKGWRFFIWLLNYTWFICKIIRAKTLAKLITTGRQTLNSFSRLPISGTNRKAFYI